MGQVTVLEKTESFFTLNPGSHNVNRNQLQLVYVLYHTPAMASIPALYCLIIYVPCSYKQQKELGKLIQTVLTTSSHTELKQTYLNWSQMTQISVQLHALVLAPFSLVMSLFGTVYKLQE